MRYLYFYLVIGIAISLFVGVYLEINANRVEKLIESNPKKYESMISFLNDKIPFLVMFILLWPVLILNLFSKESK